MKKIHRLRLFLVASIILGFIIVLWVSPNQYLSLAYLKSQQIALQTYAAAHPFKATTIGFFVYTAVTAMSIPGALAMTLMAGAIFGVLWGTLIVSFASTAGATGAFLLARFLLQGFVQSRFGHHLKVINEGVLRDGPIYLLTLRLIPVIPFVGINLVMALTPISTRNFYLYSQIGMLPATFIFVNAGTQLARIDNLADVASIPVLISLSLLALIPLARKALAYLMRYRL